MVKKHIKNFLIILAFVAVIVIFITSLGTVNITEIQELKENKDSENNLSKLQSRHKRLKFLIQKKEELNLRLNKKFKRIYFGVRIVLVALYIGYNALLYFVFNITKLSDLLNYNQLAIIVITLCSFIAFGTFANVKEFVANIKMTLESKTYSKHINLDEELTKHKIDESHLIASIHTTQLKLPDSGLV